MGKMRLFTNFQTMGNNNSFVKDAEDHRTKKITCLRRIQGFPSKMSKRFRLKRFLMKNFNSNPFDMVKRFF